MKIDVNRENDGGYYLETQLLDAYGKPINLENCKVCFHLFYPYSTLCIRKPVIITDTNNGFIYVDCGNDLIDLILCEFEITFPDGTIYTIPRDWQHYMNNVTPFRKICNDRTIDICTDWRDDKQPGAISACNIL